MNEELDELIERLADLEQDVDGFSDSDFPRNQGPYVDKARSHVWDALHLLKSVKAQLEERHG